MGNPQGKPQSNTMLVQHSEKLTWDFFKFQFIDMDLASFGSMPTLSGNIIFILYFIHKYDWNNFAMKIMYDMSYTLSDLITDNK